MEYRDGGNGIVLTDFTPIPFYGLKVLEKIGIDKKGFSIKSMCMDHLVAYYQMMVTTIGTVGIMYGACKLLENKEGLMKIINSTLS